MPNHVYKWNTLVNIDYKWILNKREYHWLARHLPAKPAQDIVAGRNLDVLDGKIVKIIYCASLHSMIQNQTKGTFVVINDQYLQVPYIDFLCVDGGERKSFFSVTFRFRMAEQYWVLIKPLSTSCTTIASSRTLLCTWMIETTESISLIDILRVDFYYKNQKYTYLVQNKIII